MNSRTLIRQRATHSRKFHLKLFRFEALINSKSISRTYPPLLPNNMNFTKAVAEALASQIDEMDVTQLQSKMDVLETLRGDMLDAWSNYADDEDLDSPSDFDSLSDFIVLEGLLADVKEALALLSIKMLMANPDTRTQYFCTMVGALFRKDPNDAKAIADDMEVLGMKINTCEKLISGIDDHREYLFESVDDAEAEIGKLDGLKSFLEAYVIEMTALLAVLQEDENQVQQLQENCDKANVALLVLQINYMMKWNAPFADEDSNDESNEEIP